MSLRELHVSTLEAGQAPDVATTVQALLDLGRRPGARQPAAFDATGTSLTVAGVSVALPPDGLLSAHFVDLEMLTDFLHVALEQARFFSNAGKGGGDEEDQRLHRVASRVHDVLVELARPTDTPEVVPDAALLVGIAAGTTAFPQLGPPAREEAAGALLGLGPLGARSRASLHVLVGYLVARMLVLSIDAREEGAVPAGLVAGEVLRKRDVLVGPQPAT